MKKLIIQIPCLNEEKDLPIALSELPRNIEGIDKIEWLIIDDGSTDNTVNVAKKNGVDHIVQHTKNKGLAEAFKTGMNASLSLGADIVVNTDADNQYPGKYIRDLVYPILSKEADIVIGDRETDKIQHFSLTKKILQKLGSWVVRKVSGTSIPDAPSGFRAYSKEAIIKLNILTKYTYTLETIIQAGKKNIDMIHVPIQTNYVKRPSRLLKGNFSYVMKSSSTIFQLFVFYQPLKFFILLSSPFLLFGIILWARYLILNIIEDASRGAYIQSVIVGGIGILIGVFILCLGVIGDLLAKNRQLLEEQIFLQKKSHY